MSAIKAQITEAMKAAMRAKEQQRLTTIRLILSECKQIEVDERIELDDTRVLAILDKMLKQRRDSIQQFDAAGRADLVAIETAEMAVIKGFMPEPLSDDEVKAIIADAVVAVGAESMKDMAKVIAHLRPSLQGRTDMGKVSLWVKERLSS